jgi:hypothetical protein
MDYRSFGTSAFLSQGSAKSSSCQARWVKERTLRHGGFYEARPVKNKICLIGSIFYPGFHVPSKMIINSWSHSTYTTTPILCGELEAQVANRAVV